MASTEFQISKNIIDWIAQKEGVDIETLSEIIAPKKKDRFTQGWINKSMAEKLIKIGNIPFGFLFLTSPPELKKPKIPDLRTVVNKLPLSDNFYETLEDIKYKIDWYKDYLIDIGGDNKLKYVGKYNFDHNLSCAEVSNDIIKSINFNINRTSNFTKDNYFSYMVNLIENAGILVFKNGIVKNNTFKKLESSEFRGFALVDDIAPAVFINGTDAMSAQLFTLCHEVAHIWIGQNGVSDWSSDLKIEAFCNKVAAEILMPEYMFVQDWNRLISSYGSNIEQIKEISKNYKVSSYAAAIRLAQLGLINNQVVDEIKEEVQKSYLNRKQGTGGNFYNSTPYRNSPTVTKAIVASAMSRKILLREAGNLLNIKADSVVKLYNEKYRARTY